MEVKLTLKLNESSIARAKKYVSSVGTSLSDAVEKFFDSLTLNNQSEEFVYSPLVKELAGIISLSENYNYKEEYTSYLESKYE